MATYSGKCHCGQVSFTTKGEPLFAQYCHCNKCREVASHCQREQDHIGYSWTAAFLTANLHFEQGEDNLLAIRRNNATLYECGICHCLIYGISIDPALQQGIGINANNFVFAGNIPDTFLPVRHVYYTDRKQDIDDILPKFKDMPTELGGSGELVL